MILLGFMAYLITVGIATSIIDETTDIGGISFVAGLFWPLTLLFILGVWIGEKITNSI